MSITLSQAKIKGTIIPHSTMDNSQIRELAQKIKTTCSSDKTLPKNYLYEYGLFKLLLDKDCFLKSFGYREICGDLYIGIEQVGYSGVIPYFVEATGLIELGILVDSEAEDFEPCIKQDISSFPENWYLVVTDENIEQAEQWRRSKCSDHWAEENYLDNGTVLLSMHLFDTSYFFGGCKEDFKTDDRYTDYVEITTEQFMEFVYSKKEPNTITRKNLESIYKVACHTWKCKFTEVMASQGLFNDTFILSDAFIEEMFKASDKAQKEVLKKAGLKLKPKSLDVDTTLGEIVSSEGEHYTNPMASFRSSGDGIIEVRQAGDCRNKSFYLNKAFNWEMKKDNFGSLVLIPTLKEAK